MARLHIGDARHCPPEHFPALRAVGNAAWTETDFVLV
jgi:hypothetical protein